MSEFTDQDRNILIETHTLVKAQGEKLKDHETRIRKNEGVVMKVIGIYSFITVAIGAFITTFVRKNM